MEVVHPADILMADLTGRLDLVLEPLDDSLLSRDLGLDELESDFLFELRIVDPINPAHAAVS